MTNKDTAGSNLGTLQEALTGSASELIESFPIKATASENAHLVRARSFGDITLDELLRIAAASKQNAEHDFVSQAARGDWPFDGVNPYIVLWPLYQQLARKP